MCNDASKTATPPSLPQRTNVPWYTFYISIGTLLDGGAATQASAGPIRVTANVLN